MKKSVYYHYHHFFFKIGGICILGIGLELACNCGKSFEMQVTLLSLS